jgi:hypothetical protein
MSKLFTKKRKKQWSIMAKKYNFGKWMLGKKHSKETIKKMRKSHKGKKGYWKDKKQPQSLIDKRVEKLIGHNVSEETKKKIGDSQQRGKNHNWKGGRASDSHGYILIKIKGHPFASKANYVREHRLVAEKMLGRYLNITEPVHHINGIRDDNRPKNLMIFANHWAHKKYAIIQEGMKEGEIIFDGRNFKHFS